MYRTVNRKTPSNFAILCYHQSLKVSSARVRGDFLLISQTAS